MLAHREELLAPDGPVNAFCGSEVRVVLRATRMYARLLIESYHPNVLRNALDRDKLLDHLWMTLRTRPHLERVIPHELADLRRGDIPYFSATPYRPS